MIRHTSYRYVNFTHEARKWRASSASRRFRIVFDAQQPASSLGRIHRYQIVRLDPARTCRVTDELPLARTKYRGRYRVIFTGSGAEAAVPTKVGTATRNRARLAPMVVALGSCER